MAKPTREEVEALLGKTTPLPVGKRGGNWDSKANMPVPAASAADMSGVTNPKRVVEKRLKEAEEGMACGGKVRMKSGGPVRGAGCALRGRGRA